jgi:hypothetical protein
MAHFPGIGSLERAVGYRWSKTKPPRGETWRLITRRVSEKRKSDDPFRNP